MSSWKDQSGANDPAARDEALFLDQARQALDHGCDALDGYTRSRLTAIRHEAIARQTSPLRFPRWISATGIVSACSLLVVFTLFTGSPVSEEVQVPSDDALQNMDLLTAEEGLEFFEDYEFYQWLAENSPPA